MIWWSHVNLFTRKIFLINLLFNMEKIHNIFFLSSVLLCFAPMRLRRLFTRTHFFLNNKKEIPRAESGCWVTSQSFPHFWQRTLLTHIRTRYGESWELLGKKYKVKRKSRLASHEAAQAAYFLPTSFSILNRGGVRVDEKLFFSCHHLSSTKAGSQSTWRSEIEEKHFSLFVESLKEKL